MNSRNLLCEIVSELELLTQNFQDSATTNSLFSETGRSLAYTDCSNMLLDYIETLKCGLKDKSENCVNLIEDSELILEAWKILKGFATDCRCGGISGNTFIQFGVVQTLGGYQQKFTYRIYATQYNVLRSLLEYSLNNNEDLNEVLWKNFLSVYDKECCDE